MNMLTKSREVAQGTSIYGRKRRRRPSLWLIGASVPVLLMLIAGSIFIAQKITASHAANAANPNPNCNLIVPANPLTAQGLMTPYQLVATNAGQGPCNEANTAQSAFVQAVILDPATGAMTAYEPLVVDKGKQPAVPPAQVTLPANAVVGLWFGFNGTTLTLQGGANGNCVNGTQGSPFGQFAHCNAPNFFQAANGLIAAGTITVPALGTANDGKPCPTTRDFSAVDMDQSDNVQTLYLANANGQIAQFSAANKTKLANATQIGNPSDNALITKFIDPALGCKPWTIPDQVDNNNPISTFGTDELQAAAMQAAPVALIPAGDPMTLVNNQQSLAKTNLYRAGANQPQAASIAADANTTMYCQNLVNTQIPRLQMDMANFKNQASPDGGATANSLFTFLANRLNASLGANGLNCTGLLKIQNPVALTTNGNGVVTAAKLTFPPVPANGNGQMNNNGNGQMNNNGNAGTQQVTGTMTANLDTNAGNADVALNLQIANMPNQQFFVNITDQATGKQVLHQTEDTNGAGANNADTVINGLEGLTAIPTTWVATITDAKGNTLGTTPIVANGTMGTATFAAAGK